MAQASGMNMEGKFTRGEEELNKKIGSLLGIPVPWDETDYNNLRHLAKTGDNQSAKFFEASRQIGKGKE